MTAHILELTSFRALFPEFASSNCHSDILITQYWNVAVDYMGADDTTILSGDVRQYALNLLTAHLVKSFDLLNKGQTSVLVTGSTEGSVSVQLTPPPVKNAFQWWLSTTGYGAQLRALLSVKTAGGLYIGGSLERASFRKAGGVF